MSDRVYLSPTSLVSLSSFVVSCLFKSTLQLVVYNTSNRFFFTANSNNRYLRIWRLLQKKKKRKNLKGSQVTLPCAKVHIRVVMSTYNDTRRDDKERTSIRFMILYSFFFYNKNILLNILLLFRPPAMTILLRQS